MVVPGGKILDAGCGDGFTIPYFARAGFQVSGIDSSSAMLELAAERNPGVDLIRADIRKTPFPGNCFDGIWSGGVMLHLSGEEMGTAMGEFSRIMKNGGALFISTRTNLKDHTEVEQASEGDLTEVHYHSTGRVLEYLEKNSFRNIRIYVERDDWGRPFDYLFANALLRKTTS